MLERHWTISPKSVTASRAACHAAPWNRLPNLPANAKTDEIHHDTSNHSNLFWRIDPYRAQRAEHDSYATCEDSKEFVYQHGTSRTRTRLDHSQRTISTASSKEDLPSISTSISVSLFSLSRPVPRFFSTAKICLNLCTRNQAQLLSNLTTTLLHPSGDTKSSETGKVNTHYQNSLKDIKEKVKLKNKYNKLQNNHLMQPTNIFWQLFHHGAHISKEHHIPLKDHAFRGFPGISGGIRSLKGRFQLRDSPRTTDPASVMIQQTYAGAGRWSFAGSFASLDWYQWYPMVSNGLTVEIDAYRFLQAEAPGRIRSNFSWRKVYQSLSDANLCLYASLYAGRWPNAGCAFKSWGPGSRKYSSGKFGMRLLT